MRSHVHSNENSFFTLEVKDCLETLSTSDINETTLVGYLIKVDSVFYFIVLMMVNSHQSWSTIKEQFSCT